MNQHRHRGHPDLAEKGVRVRFPDGAERILCVSPKRQMWRLWKEVGEKEFIPDDSCRHNDEGAVFEILNY